MRNPKKYLYRNGCRVLFGVYLIFLIKIVLFKYRGFFATMDGLFAGELSGFRSFNILPFRSIWEFTKIMFSGQFSRGFNNIIGNILVFAPFGYFLPLLHRNCRTWKTVLRAGFLLSLLLETCQYVLYLGSADIDDVLLNVLGAGLGFSFFRGMMEMTYKQETKRYGATIVLSVIGFVVAGYLAVDYFGIMFGMETQSGQTYLADGQNASQNGDDQYETMVVLSEKQPREEQPEADLGEKFDLYGSITALDAASVTVNKVTAEDLGGGKGIASMSLEAPDLQTIYLTETTKYIRKDIYDANGNRVETSDAGKNDLEIDNNIKIQGYRRENQFYAEEIVIENFLFQ